MISEVNVVEPTTLMVAATAMLFALTPNIAIMQIEKARIGLFTLPLESAQTDGRELT